MIWSSMNTTFMTAGLPEAIEPWIKDQVNRAEKIFSRFISDNEISLYNQGVAPQSVAFYSLLNQAIHFHQESEGWFQPFLGNHLCRLGYDKSFEKLSDVSSQQGTPKSTGKLDLGGICKGWIAHSCYQRLYAIGVYNGLLDAGGDIILWGKNNFTPWVVGINLPNSETPLAYLQFNTGAAIATSSTQKRKWSKNGTSMHHLIDPTTKLQSQSNCIQSTVIAPSLTEADVYAKVLLLQGCEKGAAWIQQHKPDLAYITVSNSGVSHFSSNLSHYCLDIQRF